MHMLKLLSFLFLALYFVIVGLEGLGVSLAFVHPGVLGFIALVAGVLFLVRAVKAYTCCKTCDKPYDKPPYDKT